MPSNHPEPDAPVPKDYLDAFKGLPRPEGAVPAEQTSTEEFLPDWDPDAAAPVAADIPLATAAADDAPLALAEPAFPISSDEAPTLKGIAPPENLPLATPAAPAGEPTPCPVCGAARPAGAGSCADCGYYFAADDDIPMAEAVVASTGPPRLVRNRYEIGQLLGERGGVSRFRGRDLGEGADPGGPVVVLREPVPPAALEVPVAAPADADAADDEGEDFFGGTDDAFAPSMPSTEEFPRLPTWPSLAWEHALLDAAAHPGLPRALDYFVEDGYIYLVEEVPTGRVLWDVWDDPDWGYASKFAALAGLADVLQALLRYNATLESVRPDIVVLADDGVVRLTDLGDLLPLPVPADAPIRGTLYTAPEVAAGTGGADARALLYSFGATLYALHVGRELTEGDFDGPGNPKPFVPRFPDVHPAFGRLMMKTFRREPQARFPTDEAGKEDYTGFSELMRTLRVLARTFDTVRLEIAAWTTTGMVRTGNEDAFALLHACETRQDDLSESALVLLCDGMGGYEAGEVAAALALQVMRQHLVAQKPFAHLAGGPGFARDPLEQTDPHEGHATHSLDPEVAKQLLKGALAEANKQIYAASRAPGSKRRGMGCTAECVYIDGRHVVVGHVGDSRTYHLHEGQLIQLTRDQTLVNRLVELGTLSAEEAETHPRKNELQQAIGGQPTVEPGLYASPLKPGDWVVVCSDGVTNHVNARDLKTMLQSEAQSAEMAARRLVNLTNIEGATDNATVVVVRVT